MAKKLNLKEIKHLEDVHGVLLAFMIESKIENLRLGYVSGIVSSDGVAHIPRNFARLRQFAEYLETLHNFPIFSTADIFEGEVYEKLKGTTTEEQMRDFWRRVMEHKLITDLFMTPGWERSVGATDEHETGTKLGLKIHYIKDLPLK